MNYQQLTENIQKKKSFLCVGLDTDIEKIPVHFSRTTNSVFDFNKQIIDATAPYTIAYKPNMAFYECLGIEGWKMLEKTVCYIKENHPDIFLIADAKRGDIGNTSKMYAKAFFKQLPFDAVTVAPYMGEDSIKPFLEFDDKWVIVLALTSNKGAEDFQYHYNSSENQHLFEKVLQKTQTWGTKENMMYVVGATKAEKLKEIRQIIPEHFLLVPGVGAQGGSLESVAKYGLTKNVGLIVNSSREILYADSTQNFASIAGEKAKQLQRTMSAFI